MTDRQIKLVSISPAKFVQNRNPIEDPWIAAGLRRTVTTFGETYPHDKIGIVVIDGAIEKFSFENTDAEDRAKRVDGLAIWITRNAKFPPINEDVQEKDRVPLFNWFVGVTKFTQLHALLKVGLLKGVEIQLVRKVLAIGCEIKHVVDNGNGNYGLNHVWQTEWIQVPLDDKDRFPGHIKKKTKPKRLRRVTED